MFTIFRYIYLFSVGEVYNRLGNSEYHSNFYGQQPTTPRYAWSISICSSFNIFMSNVGVLNVGVVKHRLRVSNVGVYKHRTLVP